MDFGLLSERKKPCPKTRVKSAVLKNKALFHDYELNQFSYGSKINTFKSSRIRTLTGRLFILFPNLLLNCENNDKCLCQNPVKISDCRVDSRPFNLV